MTEKVGFIGTCTLKRGAPSKTQKTASEHVAACCRVLFLNDHSSHHIRLFKKTQKRSHFDTCHEKSCQESQTAVRYAKSAGECQSQCVADRRFPIPGSGHRMAGNSSTTSNCILGHQSSPEPRYVSDKFRRIFSRRVYPVYRQVSIRVL